MPAFLNFFNKAEGYPDTPEELNGALPRYLEMYYVPGQDPITTESFNAYENSKVYDEKIDKKIYIKFFLTQENILSMPEEKRTPLIMMSMFSADKQEQDLALGVLLKLTKKERIKITPLLVNYAMDRIDSQNPEVQLAASKYLVVNNLWTQKLVQKPLSELILPKAQKLIEASNLLQTEKLFGISDSRAWRIALEMTEYLPTQKMYNNLIYAVNGSKAGVAVEAITFITDSIVFAYESDSGTEGPYPTLISEALKNNDIIVIKEVAKKINFLRMDEEGRTVMMQLYNMPKDPSAFNYPISDIFKVNVFSTEHVYKLKAEIIKKSHFDIIGKKLIKKLIKKLKQSLSYGKLKEQELAVETIGLILNDIKDDEVIVVKRVIKHRESKLFKTIVKDKEVWVIPEDEKLREKVITDEERSELQKIVLDKVEEGLKKPYIEIQKSAARMIRYIPKDMRIKYINELLDNPNPEIKKIATRLIDSAPEAERSKIFQNAIDKGLINELIEAPLYDKYDDKGPNIQDQEKTGYPTKLVGDKRGKTIIRYMTPRTFLAWKDLFDEYAVWQKKGFTYVPIEPIQSYKLNEEGWVEVSTGVLDLNVSQWLSKTDKFKIEIENQIKKIKDVVLRDKGIIHGHTHIRNFCLRFFRDKNGNPDLNKIPRVYLIDFDKAIF